VMGQKEAVKHVLLNLVCNALTYVGEGVRPYVTIYAERREGKVRCCVGDNGLGIEPRYYDKIFELFQRLPSAAHVEGTGIGLAIVKTAIERMGGTVGLKSTVGEGSTFWFELQEALAVEANLDDPAVVHL
jgi:signal transduction histidine kinase